MEAREKDYSHAGVTIFFESRNSLAHTAKHRDRISRGDAFRFSVWIFGKTKGRSSNGRFHAEM